MSELAVTHEELRRLAAVKDDHFRNAERLAKRCVAVEAENARLREALEKVLHWAERYDGHFSIFPDPDEDELVCEIEITWRDIARLRDAIDYARAALHSKEGE